MASSLFTPILNDRTRAPNFFNGRLLTGEAMSDEQRAQRTANELLAQAVGDGVAYGLEVTPASVSSIDRPVVSIKSGVAINRRGEILLLANDTQVQLVRPAEVLPDPTKLFRACTPVTTGAYIADAGVYLLTVSSIRAGNGLAQVNGLGDTPAGCNVKYIVDAVEFRLLELPVAGAILGDVARLRNLVAYQCFGIGDLADFATDPLETASEPRTLLDDIRGVTLTDCDVPLAILYWTAAGGIQWIDLWAVRRRLTETKAAGWLSAFTDLRRATAEAMLLQFQDEIAKVATLPNSVSFAATSRFRYLPPFGMIPVGSVAGRDFSTVAFFATLKVRGPFYLEGSRVASVIRQAAAFFPIDLQSQELIWLYRVRENQQAIDDLTGATPRAGLFFVTGHAPWRGDAHYDVSKWNYASYA